VAGLAKCTGRQSSGLRCLDLAADIIEKRSRCFLTPDMADRSSQRFRRASAPTAAMMPKVLIFIAVLVARELERDGA
jgi:hypothetical protein